MLFHEEEVILADEFFDVDVLEEVEEVYDPSCQLAEQYLLCFFNQCDIKDVPRKRLCQAENLERIVNLSVYDGVGELYILLGEGAIPHDLRRRGELPADIRYVLSMYNRCSKLGIPKCWATGILALYFELYNERFGTNCGLSHLLRNTQK